MVTCSVYKLTSPSGMVYIGMSSSPAMRFYSYKNSSCKGQPLLHAELQSFGWDNFTKEIIFAGLPKNEAGAKESELIDFYKFNGQSLNKNGGGQSGASKPVIQFDRLGNYIQTFESASQAAIHINNNIDAGITTSAIRSAATSRRSNGYLKWLWLYENDYKSGISPIKSQVCRPVAQFDVKGIFISLHQNGVNDAVTATGVSAGAIYKCLREKTYISGGFKWMFYEDYLRIAGTDEFSAFCNKIGKFKLSPTEVISMREMRKEGKSNRFLSDLFGIEIHAVRDIIKRKNWKT
jgi:hypothetical protein